MIGRSLLHYRILSKLGAGGMGEVFLALDTKLQREVALKLLPAAVADDRRRWERFVREARAVAALDHPNIVTVFAAEEVEGRHFFTMERVDGDTLDRTIPAGGMPLERFFALALPLVDAIAAAHRRGITHRDLKPENVMVTRDGRVKVLDFGMAKPAAEQEGAEWSGGRLTEEGTVVGTARYMAPEQASGGVVDHRSDLFSLGIMLYEMTTGAYPFKGRSSIEVLSSILRDTPALASSLRRSLPQRLGLAIHRCLEKRPELRYPAADELAAELVAAQRDSTAGPAVELEGTWAEPVARPRVATRSSSGTTSRPGSLPALAVLPLVDLSGEPDYFVEGLTEELITSMAKIGSLRVISRQSVMRYRNSIKLLPEIAREIGVDHVLEGSVLRSGDRVRISLQLVRADPEQNLWAERYDRDLGDVLSLHSEVARAVASEIEVTLTAQEEARLAEERPVAPEVFEAYLKGRYYLNKRSQEGLKKAVGYFEEAIELDPSHAPSHAGLADVVALLAHRASSMEMAERARAAARRALELDPQLAEAHTALGFIRFFFDWDWAEAERELQLALELAPNLAIAHTWYWLVLITTGRRDEARQEIHRARELDPLAPVIASNLGLHYYLCGEYRRAIRHFNQSRELEPGFAGASLGLWRTYEHLEEHDAAAEAVATGLRELGRPEVAAVVEQRYPQDGYGATMAAAAEMLAGQPASVPLETIAWMFLASGDRDRAMEMVEKAFAVHAPTVVWLGIAKDWDPVRDEPRFREILTAVGLPHFEPPGGRRA